MEIDVPGGIVTASSEGFGHPLVLLHSLLADRGSFDRIVPDLAREFRVITLDLPGFGGSTAATGGLAEVADAVAAALREIIAGEKPVVVGNGFGGFVALQMALRYPDLAAALVLADTGAAFSEPGRASFRAMASAAAAHGLEAVADTAMRRLFAPAFQAENPAMMAERRAAFLRTDMATFQAACHALATLDIREAVARIELPCLVLVGEEDEATPPPMSAELASLLPDARLKVLSGCAHVPQLQNPALFLAAIGEALAPFARAVAQDEYRPLSAS